MHKTCNLIEEFHYLRTFLSSGVIFEVVKCSASLLVEALLPNAADSHTDI